MSDVRSAAHFDVFVCCVSCQVSCCILNECQRLIGPLDGHVGLFVHVGCVRRAPVPSHVRSRVSVRVDYLFVIM
jgi:hypothetical protein